ncbi:MAG TPA: hypothetical protein VK814_06605 [Acidobacteriaceae bacterium]|jgi:hypothetical protein|nr:hypothetical protein [Acidobacteriaceae bacterium]
MSSLFFPHWGLDWLWSVPLIVLTVLFHSFALRIVNNGVDSMLKANGGKAFRQMVSIIAVGGPALFATVAHGLEAWLWGLAYLLSGAVSDQKAAMEYSLGAMTTFGTSPLRLGSGWQLMGPLEALNGWILFGLTTAFLFTIVRKVWSTDAWV